MAVFTSTTLGVNLYYAFTQNPATIASAATITNVTANYNGDAVYGDTSYAWTVYNFGTAEGTQIGSSGVRLAAGGDVHNASTGRIAGDAYGVAILAAAGTVTNYGTIGATGATASNAGVYAGDGSIVTNGASGYSALITGYDGVRVAGIGTVTNYGTISGFGIAGHGVYLYGGGYVTNQSSGLITGGSGIGFGIAAGTVNNYGTVAGQNGLGVELLDGGTVSNQLGGLITGYVAGIRIDGAVGSVVNFATIDSGTGGGIYLQGGGNVTNLATGRIDAYVNGIFINGGSGTVVNFGSIETTLAGGGAVGVDINSGGYVVNQATGAIIAASGRAAEIGSNGALVNAGTIANSDGGGVGLQGGGRVDNFYSGLISGTSTGVDVQGGVGTVFNGGTIAGSGVNSYGVRLYAGGDVANASASLITGDRGVAIQNGGGTLTNYGTITGTAGGVHLDGGAVFNLTDGLIAGRYGVRSIPSLAVTNYGTIAGSGISGYYSSGVFVGGGSTVVNGPTQPALITGYDGVRITGTGTVTNHGTISGVAAGVSMGNAGLVINYSTGTIAGQFGIVAGTGIGTLVNAGTIIATGGPSTGIDFASSGTVINSGLVHTTGGNAVEIGVGAGTIDNSGTIVSYYGGGFTGYGVFLLTGGQVTNQIGALIYSYHGGIRSEGGGTVINYGTVSGDTAAVIIDGGPALVLNYGTLTGLTGTGGRSDGVAIELGGTVVNSDLISAPDGHGVYIYGSGGTVTNSGTIVSGGAYYGVYLTAGGFVTNQAGGLIEAAGPGIHSRTALVVVTNLGTIAGYSAIDLTGAAGTVANSGTVAGTLHGVHLVSGGIIANAAGGVITGYFAANVLGGAGTVINSGLIQRTGSNGAAVLLQSGGIVVNNLTGTIAGPLYGNAIRVDGSTGTLTNYGIVQSAAAGDEAVYFGAGGTVANFGLISGADDVVLIRVDGLVTNDGTIVAAGEAAVWMADGGTVVNNGLLTATNDVVFTGYTAGTIINYGTIINTGFYGDGVCLDAGGIVSNSGIIVGAALGVMADNDVATVANLGTISATYSSSTGVWLRQGGVVVNGDGGTPSALIEAGADGVVTGYGGVGAGAVTNYGTIIGPNVAVWLSAGGSLTNFGTIESLGGGDGVTADYAAGVVSNAVTGLIDADNLGVWLQAGGTVFNSGVIRGGNNGVDIQGAAGTLVSDGTVEGTGGSGVVLGAGGLVRNNIGGVIEGGNGGVHAFGALGTVINYSTITATGGYDPGIYLHGGGSVFNHETGLIDGTSDAIDIFGAAGTVINLGTVDGGSRGVLLAAGGTVANGTSGPGGAVIAGGYYGVTLIYLGGAITNGTAALTDAVIQGGRGIFSRDGAATVTNYGTIEGTTQGAVYLNAGGAVTNGAAASTAARIEGAHGVVIDGAAGTLVNFGTVEATYVTGVGVFLGQGGTVTNGGSATTDALISGARRGIIVYDAVAAIDNFGTIAASITYVPAVQLLAGGIVTNRPDGLIDGGGQGVSISGGAGTVINYGVIAGTSGGGVALAGGGTIVNGLTTDATITGGYGVVLTNYGGTVFNGGSGSTAAVIDGDTYGIFAVDGASTVANFGTITGTAGAGVVLADGGVVVNTYYGLIASADTGVQIANAAGALSNAGAVLGGDLGAYFLAGGSVFNDLSGTIAGGDGIRINGGVGTVTNYGAIDGTGTSGFAVQLAAGGTVVNGAATAASAAILGTLRGISVYTAAGSVTNFGTIAASVSYATAVYLHAGGSLTNRQSGLIQGGGAGVIIDGAAGTVTNRGTIDGVTGVGVVLAGGGVIVNGPGGSTAALISGGEIGVVLLNVPATIVNYGTIVDADYSGVDARAGGNISNDRLIAGYQYGAAFSGGPGTVANSGDITASGTGGTGISLAAGGFIDNSGTIAGGRNGVFFGAATSIANQGLINGTGVAGVYGAAGVGIVSNYGTIGGGVVGVRLVGGSTLFNAGTIAGGSLSVYFINGANRLAIDPSAVFIGNVDAQIGAAGDVLELAPGFGTSSGFGTGFVGFEAIEVDVGADWQVAGALTLDAGFLVTDAGALDFDNDLTNDGTLEIEANAVLSFTGTVGGTGTIDFNGSNGVLVFGVPSVMTNSIIDFTPTNIIGFVGIGLAASYSYSGGVLRLNNSGGTAIAQVNLTTPVTNPHFMLASSGSSTFVAVNALTGTFTGTYFNGVVLNAPTVQNPALVTAFITNNYGGYGGDAVYGTSAAAWNLTNQGTITTNPTATGAAGVRFEAGGTIANAATIVGSLNGIVINGGAGTIANNGLIASGSTTTGAGIGLSAGGGVSNAAGGTILGFHGIAINGSAGAVANDGTIVAIGSASGSGILLGLGGSLTNAAGASISGFFGVSVFGAAVAIANSGTIFTPGGTNSSGIYLAAGGTISNLGTIAAPSATNGFGIHVDGGGGKIVNGQAGSTAGLISGYHIGIRLSAGTAFTVVNYGLVQSTQIGTAVGTGFSGSAIDVQGSATIDNFGTIAASQVGGGFAIFAAGGLIVNEAGGLIDGAGGNAISGGSTGTGVTVSNFGTILNSSTASAAVFFGHGGTLTNAAGGLIVSAVSGAHWNNTGGVGVVNNAGTIVSTAITSGTGVYFGQGGVLTNSATGLIAAYRTAVSVRVAAGSINNYGTIQSSATFANGVYLVAGGSVTNGRADATAALIQAGGNAIDIRNAAGTITNFGTLAASGTSATTYLGAGGIVVNYGLISGARSGGSGSYPGAVQISNQTGVVINLGTIANPDNSNGVNLLQGGILINGAGGYNAALIDAPHTAVYIGGTLGATGTVINYGTIRNTTGLANAVTIAAGGTAINYGLIASARTGVAFTNTAGTVNNFGTIVSTAPLSGTRGAGVYLAAGGSITNQAGGLITAERAAVSLAFFGSTSAGAVITNFGTLSGATGISIGAGDTGDNTIINYGTITGTNGIAILLGGGEDEIVISSTSQMVGAVSNFQIGDTFDLPFLVFSSAETVSLDPGNVLNISQSGALVYSIQLDPAQSFGASEFSLTTAPSGGTLVVLGPDVTPPVTLTRVLAVDANSGPTPIGIAAPADPDDPPASLTVTVTGLPTDGTVVLSDGVTPVSGGQILNVAQLTALQFVPTPGLSGQSSTFTYSVGDPAGNAGVGTAFLGINLPPPPNSPSLINGLGGVEGFGENALPPNDDESSSAIDITAVFESGLSFFGNVYTTLFVNNNGNITFNGPLGTFTPEEITAGFGNPIIAAFWADVDTTGGPGVPTGGNATGSNTVYWDVDPVTGGGIFTVTWNDVGYFGGHNDKLDAFQLRLIDQGGGDFDIEFRYQAIYWTTGDFSGGFNGLDDPNDPEAEAAHAGFSAGDGLNSYELPQSGDQNAMLGLPSNPAPPGTAGVTGETGVYLFQVRNGEFLLPILTNLALSPASDSGRPGDNRTNDTTPTIIGAGGIIGNTVTLRAGGTVVGTGTVGANGNWSVTASLLPDGFYSLTAIQTNPGGAASESSQELVVFIDTSPPEPVPVSRTVQPNTGPAEIGIGLPPDPDDDFNDPNQAPTIIVGTLPTNGTVTLGGVTPVSTGQQLTISQLTGLDFTPTGQLGSTSSFTYTVTDLAGNTGSGTATFTIATPPPPPAAAQLFGFLFTYNDGKDYYLGTVADAGNFGYQIGQTINTVAGHYQIVSIESTLTAQPSGTVSVSIYSHGGVGQASPTPVKTGQGLPDGANGLGSETDAILGLDGDLHPFSGAVEASFQTIPLWSFIYTYADGRAFYTGTVASQTPVNSRTVTDSAGNIIGNYSVFQQGLTTRTDGTVVVDRFTLNGLSFIPLRTGVSSVNGQGGLGTEQGLITVNGATFAFSNGIEPAVTVSHPSVPSTPAPNPNDVATAQITSLYRDILGRNPDPAGLSIFTNALANGASLASIRTTFAQSSEAQSALNQLYRQIFGRDIDPIGANIYTGALINGSSLASVQVILAQSPEAQSAIQRIYQQVLDRPADGAGLTSYMAVLGNPTAPMSLSDVRTSVAHSGEAAADLSQLVLDTLHRPTFAAELVAMENEISTDGVTQQTLQAELASRNTAGTYSTVFDPAGSNLLAAQAGIPTLFVFTDVNLASDGIVGFDLIRDTIQLPTAVAADFQTVQSRMQPNSSINGTLIHFNSSQEIAIAGVTPGSLTAANFRFA